MLNEDEEITLFCIKDEQEQAKSHWLNLWEKGYPISCSVSCSPNQTIIDNIDIINQRFEQIPPYAFIVAYGYGCIAFLAWLTQVGLLTQRTICGAILVAPPLDDEGQVPILLKNTIQRAYTNFPTTLVASENDAYCTLAKAQSFAHNIHARFYNAGKVSHFEQQAHLGSWEKGMALMQTMLLDQ